MAADQRGSFSGAIEEVRPASIRRIEVAKASASARLTNSAIRLFGLPGQPEVET